MYILSVQYSCAVVSVFLFGGKANLALLPLFYSTLLTLTDRQTDRKSNLLALRGLEEPFFQLCCCVVSVFGSGRQCGNSLYIIFWRIVLEAAQIWRELLHIIFRQIVLEAAQIWRKQQQKN